MISLTWIRTEMRVLTALVLLGTAVACNPQRAYSAPSKDVKIENPAKVVNVNTASAEELQAIRGVGPAIAARILDFRKQNGRFEKVEDLAKIRGIGEAKLQRIKAQVSI